MTELIGVLAGLASIAAFVMQMLDRRSARRVRTPEPVGASRASYPSVPSPSPPGHAPARRPVVRPPGVVETAARLTVLDVSVQGPLGTAGFALAAWVIWRDGAANRAVLAEGQLTVAGILVALFGLLALMMLIVFLIYLPLSLSSGRKLRAGDSRTRDKVLRTETANIIVVALVAATAAIGLPFLAYEVPGVVVAILLVIGLLALGFSLTQSFLLHSRDADAWFATRSA